jgi:hypothetical protein
MVNSLPEKPVPSQMQARPEGQLAAEAGAAKPTEKPSMRARLAQIEAILWIIFIDTLLNYCLELMPLCATHACCKMPIRDGDCLRIFCDLWFEGASGALMTIDFL